MDIFSVKDFSTTTRLRILKFGTKFDSDESYCVTKRATYCLSVPLFFSFFFLFSKRFCRRFLRSYWRQCYQIVCTPSGWLRVLGK